MKMPNMENQLGNNQVSIGKLVGLDWKIGIAMSSDNCKNLNSPYVVLKFQIADADGKVNTKAVEMTLSEFMNFAKEMKDIGSVMDTV